jgi:hypothetical protein
LIESIPVCKLIYWHSLNRKLDIGTLSPGIDLTIKHVNLVLDVNLQTGIDSINQFLSAIDSHRANYKARIARLEAMVLSELPTRDPGLRVPVPAA